MTGALPLPWPDVRNPGQTVDALSERLQENLDALALNVGDGSAVVRGQRLTGLYSGTWTDYTATAGFTPSYARTGGIVVLGGAVTNGSAFPGSQQTMFTLPIGFRPAQRCQFLQVGVGGAGGTPTTGAVIVDVDIDGSVDFVSGITATTGNGLTNNMTYISLAGIVFRTAT